MNDGNLLNIFAIIRIHLFESSMEEECGRTSIGAIAIFVQLPVTDARSISERAGFPGDRAFIPR